MSKLDKVKLVLEQAKQPISLDKLVNLTRFDEEIVEFIVDELKATGKVRIEPTGEISWASKQQSGLDMVRARKGI